jgi:acetyl esterase/lipase
MPLDPRAKRFLDMIAAAGAKSAPTPVEQRRDAFRMLIRHAGTPSVPVSKRDVVVPGADGILPARIYGPAGRETEILPGLVFFHGGGFVVGDLDTHDGICSVLASEAGCRIVSVDYRLAPEYPFPAAVEDAWAAACALAETAATLGIDPRRLAVGGESAGANLAAVTCQKAMFRGGPAFAAQVLICPVLDAAAEGGSREDFAEGYFLDRTTFARDLIAYGPATLDLDDPRVSPLRAPDLSGLPPAIIHTAGHDFVRDDGATYACRLAEAGIPVRYTCHPGMIHFFYGLGAVIPYGQVGLKAIGSELAAALS